MVFEGSALGGLQSSIFGCVSLIFKGISLIFRWIAPLFNVHEYEQVATTSASDDIEYGHGGGYRRDKRRDPRGYYRY